MSEAGTNYLNHEKGLKSWLTTVDHKRIGIMYLWSAVAALAAGGFFAPMIRFQLYSPENDLITKQTY